MAKLFMRLVGYQQYEPNSCGMRKFPMLDLLCSTNGIPVVLDEFKESDMKDDVVKDLYRFMRKVYAGETEPKGNQHLTTNRWHITAPMCLMGEWNVGIPAISERMIMVKYTDAVKKDKTMNAALIKDIPNQIESYKKSIIVKKSTPPPYQPPKETKKTGDANEYFLLGCEYENSHSYREAIEAYSRAATSRAGKP